MPTDLHHGDTEARRAALGRVPAVLADLAVPHLHEYFGAWAIEPVRFAAMVERVGLAELRLHVAAQQPLAAAEPAPSLRREYEMLGPVAVVPLEGTLMKAASSEERSTSTVRARRQVRAAAGDDEVGAILLRIDSPGGTVSGTGDLAADVAAASAQKPTLAYVEDLGASAAYWIASQARAIVANPTALVGSIGTFSVIYDTQARAAMLGFRAHVITTGKYKGMGAGGTDVTPEQLAYWQEVIDGLNEHFLAGVARGRRLAPDAVAELADGRVFLAAEAQRLKLIDRVGSFDQALEQLTAMIPRSSQKKGRAMSETPQTGTLQLATAELRPVARPANLQELRGACPGASADFLLAQLEANATVEQAKDAWIARQNELLAAKHQALEQAQAAARKPGAEPVGTGKLASAAETGDAIAAWNEALQAKLALGLPKAKATAAVVREQPELHGAYIREVNARRPQPLSVARGF